MWRPHQAQPSHAHPKTPSSRTTSRLNLNLKKIGLSRLNPKFWDEKTKPEKKRKANFWIFGQSVLTLPEGEWRGSEANAPPLAARPTVHVSRLFVGKFWHVRNPLPQNIRLRRSVLVRYWGRLGSVKFILDVLRC